MLLAEDLLVLATDDATGRLSVSREPVDAGLGGANLAELTLLDKVDVSGEQDQGRRGRIIVRDPSPPGDEVLDAALRILVKRQLRKRAAEIAQGNWASEAVRKAIDEEIAAGVTVVMGAAAGAAVGFSR
jgi:Golgi phosphoprotein 3 GPP34